MKNRHQDVAANTWAGLLLGLMMILAPSTGVPSEEMLQDTLKSAIVSMMAIGAAMAIFGANRNRRIILIWHHLMWLPLSLSAYALASVFWSHAYLGGVETIRWFVLSLVLFAGLNANFSDLQSKVPWGIHWGMTVASVWTALQFWTSFDLFPQGPNPASTFVNRNFFAEYAICALPYSVFLMLRSKGTYWPLILAAMLGFNVNALFMTGTRSALIALLVLLLLSPVLLLRFKPQLVKNGWTLSKSMVVLMVLFATLYNLGSIPTKNPKILSEFGAQTALSRAVSRTASMSKPEEYKTGSFSVRSTMWSATGRMIRDNPIAGVGPGAWEVYAPLYQDSGTQLETDFYAHNEVLQLLAEFGVLGWLFLGLLFSYLTYIAWQTMADRSTRGQWLAPARATALVSLLLLLIVSNAGFPMRLASTGALFALALSIVGACDANDTLVRRQIFTNVLVCESACRRAILALSATCMVLAVYITQRAAYAESNLVRGIRMGLIIMRSGNQNNDYWNTPKEEMVGYIRKGVAANRHYRKLTAIAADELASIGDWNNALWIWESILKSRPFVVAIIVNIARAHMELGNFSEAQSFLERAKSLQPTAIAVRSLNVILLSRNGQDQLAVQQAKALLAERSLDYDLVQTIYHIGKRTQDWSLAIQALQFRIKNWPSDTVDAWLNLGTIYDLHTIPRDNVQAFSAYRSALEAANGPLHDATLAKIPSHYRTRLQLSQGYSAP